MTKKKGIFIGVAVILVAAVGLLFAVYFTSPSDIISFANPNDAEVETITLIVDRRSGELPSGEQKVFTEALQKLSGKIAENEAKTLFEGYLGRITGLSYRFSDGHTATFVFSPEDENLIRVTVAPGASDVASAEAYFRVESKDFSRGSIEALQDRVALAYPDSDGTLPDGAA